MAGSIHRVIGCVLIAAGTAHAAPAGNPRPAHPPPAARPAAASLAAATALKQQGELAQALAMIDELMASAAQRAKKDDQRNLLRLKASVLLDQRDIAGALAAFQAYLDTGVRGGNAIEVQKIVANLKTAPMLDITVSNGPADVFLDSKALGPLCAAASECNRQVMPGPHRVIVERAGFVGKTERVTLQGGKPAALAVALIEKPSTITVRVAQAAATITVDDSAYTAPVELPAGDHRVVVRLDGHVDAQVIATAHEGKPVDLDVTLVAVAPPAPPVVVAPRVVEQPVHRFTVRRKLAVASGAIAIVGVGVGAVLGSQARGADHDAFALCPSPTTPCRDAAKANDLNQRGQSRATDANIAFGVAGAAAIAAAVLWLVGAPESTLAVAPRVGSNVAGLDVALRF
jgi:hypothetical protein